MHKHCGPTAMTNVILALGANEAPEAIFATVAEMGMRCGLYWNLARTKRLGGTSDALAGVYLRLCLRRYGFNNAVRAGGIATQAALVRALGENKIVYLEMHFHPKYHNHHLLIYAHEWQGFRAADGWSSSPVILNEKDIKGCTFFTIER